MQISPAIHEGSIEQLFPLSPETGEAAPCESLVVIRDAAKACREAVENIAQSESKIRGNKLATPLANERNLQTLAQKQFMKAAGKVDAANARTKARLKQLEDAVAAPRRPTAPYDMMAAGEVRAALARMPEGKRSAALANLLKEEDESAISAVLHGSPMLSGLSSDERELFRQSWQVKFRSTEVQEMKRLESAANALNHIAFLTRKALTNLTDRTAIELAEAGERIAQEALLTN